MGERNPWNQGITVPQNIKMTSISVSDCTTTTEDNQATKIKAPPISCFETAECSSIDELSRVCFSGSSTPSTAEVTSCSSASSCDLSSGLESPCKKGKISNGIKDEVQQSPAALFSHMQDGTSFQVNKSSVSRQGRDQQRWDKESDASSWVRLTTGVVPITRDGRVVFVSSARKKEWILPKGGWESDEELEQSALRESYEEAGLLGVLGPRLSDVSFETRKSKKRRMEVLELAKRVKDDNESTTEEPFSCSNSSIASSEDHLDFSIATSKLNNLASLSPSRQDKESYNNLAPPRTEEAEDSSAKKYNGICRMTLFPLYITEVLDTWPESGRSRKLFTLNEAIEMVTRPHLKTVLIELKQRGLHKPSDLVKP